MHSSDESGTVAGASAGPAARAGRPVLGVGYILAAASLFAINGTASKTVLTDLLTPVQLVELRCVISALLFLAVALVWRPARLRIRPRELALMLVYGVIGVALVQWLYFVAMRRMPISISLLIEFTAPVMIALWVRFVRGEPVRRRIWAALTMALVGLAMVARVWDGLTLDAVGLTAASVAAVGLAAYYLIGEHGVGRRDPLSVAAWSFTGAGLFWLVVHPVWQIPFDRLGTSLQLGNLDVHLPAWVLVGYVVVLGTAAPFGLNLLGLREIGATRVGLIATAEPPLAGLIAWPVLGEVLSPAQLVGAVVVLAGILLAETSRIAPAAAPVGPTG